MVQGTTQTRQGKELTSMQNILFSVCLACLQILSVSMMVGYFIDGTEHDVISL